MRNIILLAQSTFCFVCRSDYGYIFFMVWLQWFLLWHFPHGDDSGVGNVHFVAENVAGVEWSSVVSFVGGIHVPLVEDGDCVSSAQ